MNTQHLRILALAAMAGVTMSTTSALAALNYQDGDLLLGFRATGGTGGSTNYLVDLGSIATFRDATTILTLNVGTIDADLDNIFGSGWATRGDFLWSVSGVQFAAGNGYATNRNLVASRAQGFPLGLPGSSNSTPWTRATLSTQGSPALKIQALGQKFGSGTTGAISGTDQIESTNALGFALIQPNGQPNSLEEFMSGGSQSSSGSSFAYFSGGIEGGFGLGAAGAALDLYVMQPGTGNGVYEGTFTIGSNAELTFTPQGVPEPSSALMLALGGAALGFIRRRQRA